MNALSTRTSKRQKIIIKFGLLGKILNMEDSMLSKALVCTTPCPKINSEITVIKDVLLKPLKIACGFNRLYPSSFLNGNIEKKIRRNVRITIDLKTIDKLSNA